MIAWFINSDVSM